MWDIPGGVGYAEESGRRSFDEIAKFFEESGVRRPVEPACPGDASAEMDGLMRSLQGDPHEIIEERASIHSVILVESGTFIRPE